MEKLSDLMERGAGQINLVKGKWLNYRDYYNGLGPLPCGCAIGAAAFAGATDSFKEFLKVAGYEADNLNVIIDSLGKALGYNPVMLMVIEPVTGFERSVLAVVSDLYEFRHWEIPQIVEWLRSIEL